MIRIQKLPPPIALSQYKRQCKGEMSRGSTHVLDDFPEKDSLRQQLAEEQGFICAYCMSRISLDFHTTVIEHVKPQTQYPEEQLDYDNLLLCCNGDANGIGTQHHCDSSKRNLEIKYNPATHPCIATTIRYRHNGQVFSEEAKWDFELNTVLNLNASRLCNNRKAVWNVVIEWLSQSHGQRTRSEIDAKLRATYSRDQEKRLPEYCGVMAYVLKRHPSYRSRYYRSNVRRFLSLQASLHN